MFAYVSIAVSVCTLYGVVRTQANTYSPSNIVILRENGKEKEKNESSVSANTHTHYTQRAKRKLWSELSPMVGCGCVCTTTSTTATTVAVAAAAAVATTATNPLPRGECSFFLQYSAPDAYDYLYRRPEHVPNKGTT